MGLSTTNCTTAVQDRVKCEDCGASYAAEWGGTTCSVCDGTIQPLPAYCGPIGEAEIEAYQRSNW